MSKAAYNFRSGKIYKEEEFILFIKYHLASLMKFMTEICKYLLLDNKKFGYIRKNISVYDFTEEIFITLLNKFKLLNLWIMENKKKFLKHILK